MTSRRSFLKALALAAGGATIASKAVSAILTLSEHKNELAGVGEAQNGASGRKIGVVTSADGTRWLGYDRPLWADATYEPSFQLHPDIDPIEWEAIKRRLGW